MNSRNLISRSALAMLAMILPAFAGEEPLFGNPQALFQKAIVPVLGSGFRGDLTKTLRGFVLRTDGSDLADAPSETGIHLYVEVRDAEEIPTETDASSKHDGITRHVVKFPAPPDDAGQALLITIDSGAKANAAALTAIADCIEEIRGKIVVEREGLKTVFRTATSLKTGGLQPGENVLYAPDHKHFLAWIDTKRGPVLGEVRTVVFNSTIDARDEDPELPMFSLATAPAWTQAAWNADSTCCIVADQPDNGCVFVWLISKGTAGKWHPERIDPLAPLYADYELALNGKDLPMFRPHLDRIEWLSGTKVRFLVWSNLNDPKLASSGRYWVTLDTSNPKEAQVVAKIPGE